MTGCIIGIADQEGWTLFVVVLIMETSTSSVSIICLRYRCSDPMCSTCSLDHH